MKRVTSQFVEDPRGARRYDARLAMALGDRPATFVQQVHYHATWKEEQFGMREWRSSLSEWEKTFPYWSVDTIKRIIKECRDLGVLKARKGTFQGRKAVWFSLDYEKVEELGIKGAEMIEEARVSMEKRHQKVQIAPSETEEDECKLHTLPSANCTLNIVQNAHHLQEQQSTTTEISTTAKNPRSFSLRSSSLLSFNHEGKDFREDIRRRHRSTLEKRFEKNHSIQSVETLWEIMVSDIYGKEGVSALSAADKKNTKQHFVAWCEKSSIGFLEFVQWCVSSWNSLRTGEMAWAKLGKYPVYGTIYALKHKFLEQYHLRPKKSIDAGSQRKEVYTDIKQVPKNHPQFQQIKILIETKGRAEA